MEDELDNFFDVLFDYLDENTPESVISIIRYDESDNPIELHTGTFDSIFKNIKNYSDFYYRVAVLDQDTIRDRVKDEHFGVKTSCVGGLKFSISETLNRYLNRQVKDYSKGEEQNFYYLLCKFQWYVRKMEELSHNSKEDLEQELNKIKVQYTKLVEVSNLNDCKKKSGIYIMVLDEYNTLYIGQAVDIRQRIMQHWSKADYFSGTGIDLFKAFDTTRIFVLECSEKELNSLEHSIVDNINKQYQLNILTGGTIDYHIENDIPLVKDSNLNSAFKKLSRQIKDIESFADLFIVKDSSN